MKEGDFQACYLKFPEDTKYEALSEIAANCLTCKGVEYEYRYENDTEQQRWIALFLVVNPSSIYTSLRLRAVLR